ncbi:hypothetical protein [Candidatus Mycoplasma haematominutum]|uniref:Uncharacterized protein n=1 Tax=Candidatus Mycoplasma haematominutum 'Birmingham 1' TaxID=1116213 RepID=G8C408_9MOLU|nr:hypothetical protein [Candidatus Mycoplasma haematominutum]CCE67056.1 hypothetical protein (homolog to MSU_0876) [Candidatus Mycoplasma haematominutum 'Birmingham 1']
MTDKKEFLSDNELFAFSTKLVDIWRSKNVTNDKYFKKFSSLSKVELQKLIDYLIEEIEEIKGVNKLIRLRESLNTVFDLKLLYNNLKSTIQTNY